MAGGFIDRNKCDILKQVNANVNAVNLNILCSNNSADLLHTHPLSNISDITASASEINILDGTIINTTELNYISGLTAPIQDQVDDLKDGTEPFTNIQITGGSISGISPALGISDGGTGATTESGARTNLGLEIGSDIQAYSFRLTEITNIVPNNGVFIIGNGSVFTSGTGNTVLTKIGTNATVSNLDDLVGSSNCDSLHVHTTSGITDFSSSVESYVTYEALNNNSDIGQTANTVAAGNDNRFPSSNEKAALDAANSPSGSNAFATMADIGFNLAWRNPIISFYDPSTSIPPSPSTGDRYISTATANGWTEDYVYEYDGSDWDERIPSEGWTVENKDDDTYYTYNDSGNWIPFGNTISHNSTKNLQGGSSAERYHLTFAQQSGLTGGSDTGLHTHDTRYYTETEIDTKFSNILDGTTDFTRIDVDNLTIDNNTIKNNTRNNYLWLDNTGLTELVSTNGQHLRLSSATQNIMFNNTSPVLRPLGVNNSLSIQSTGMGDLFIYPGDSGHCVIVNGHPYHTKKVLSIQSHEDFNYLEIINNTGDNKGTLLGLYENNSELKNHAAGSIDFFTDTTVTSEVKRLSISNNGNINILTGSLQMNGTEVINQSLEINNLTQINVDNIRIFHNNIISTNTNGNIYIIPDGSGVVQIPILQINNSNITLEKNDTEKIIFKTSGTDVTLGLSSSSGGISALKFLNTGSTAPNLSFNNTGNNFVLSNPLGQVTIESYASQKIILQPSTNVNISTNHLEMNGTVNLRHDGSFALRTDANTSNNSLYYDSTKSDLAYKDSNGDTYYLKRLRRTVVNDVNYSVISSDELISVKSLTANRTITLPNSLLLNGRKLIIKDESGECGIYTIKIEPESTTLIDGQSNYTINCDYCSITIYSDGINWFVI